MKCSVMGLGYIGLPTSALLAKKGHKVIGVDINKEVISTVNKGKIHIIEKGLEQLVFETIKDGSFKAKSNPETSDVFLIAVPTPIKNNVEEIPMPNISYVLAAVESICNVIKKGDLVLIESTSPVGITEKVAQIIKNLTGLDKDAVNIAYCPERVIPGATLKELVQNDGEGKVLCINHTGSELCSMVGDQIAQTAFENNWNGIITNGFIRDIEVIQNINIGLYALGTYPKKTDKLKGIGEKNVPIQLGNVDINPGYWIYIDTNGWVVTSKKLEL